MKRRRVLTVIFGVLALSVGLVLLTGERVAQAAPPSKSTTNPSWDENLTGTVRFTVLSAFGGAAVRDNNTGLVWEQAPDATTRPWVSATDYCVQKTVGGTVGWRLPSVVELRSVQDPTLPAPFVPTNVFTGVEMGYYWSATTFPDIPARAWVVIFAGLLVYNDSKANTFHAWCVRGGMNADQY